MLFPLLTLGRSLQTHCGALLLAMLLSAPAAAQMKIDRHYPQVQHSTSEPLTSTPQPPPPFCKQGQICLQPPPGVAPDRLDKDELQLWAHQQEIKQLKEQIVSLQMQNAQMANQLATLLPAFQNLQTQYASHTHTYSIKTHGGFSSTGWTLFDLTEHGGHNVTVGLEFTCAPGLDPRCVQTPPNYLALPTSGPVPPKP